MRKFKNIITLGMISSLAFVSNAYAVDEAVDNSGDNSKKAEVSVNKQLSDVRTEISVQMLQTKLADVKLEYLRKQQEIATIKNQLDYGTTSSNLKTKTNTNAEAKREFSEQLDQEDILIENNNWEQNVGFIYKDDVSIGQNNGFSSQNNSPVSGLTPEVDKDFEKMLSQIAENTDETDIEKVEEKVEKEAPSGFMLTSVELNKLNIFGEDKSAKVKVNYMNDNGYQKIKGAKIVRVQEGSVFQVKNEVSFEILKITDSGITIKNLNTGKVEDISR